MRLGLNSYKPPEARKASGAQDGYGINKKWNILGHYLTGGIYGRRHLNIATSGSFGDDSKKLSLGERAFHLLVGFLECTPVFGTMVAAVEGAAASIFHKAPPSSTTDSSTSLAKITFLDDNITLPQEFKNLSLEHCLQKFRFRQEPRTTYTKEVETSNTTKQTHIYADQEEKKTLGILNGKDLKLTTLGVNFLLNKPELEKLDTATVLSKDDLPPNFNKTCKTCLEGFGLTPSNPTIAPKTHLVYGEPSKGEIQLPILIYANEQPTNLLGTIKYTMSSPQAPSQTVTLNQPGKGSRTSIDLSKTADEPIPKKKAIGLTSTPLEELSLSSNGDVDVEGASLVEVKPIAKKNTGQITIVKPQPTATLHLTSAGVTFLQNLQTVNK